MCVLKLILGTMGNLIGCRIVEIYLETHLGIFFRLQRCKEILGFSKEWYAPPGSTNLATKHKRSEEWQCVAMRYKLRVGSYFCAR